MPHQLIASPYPEGHVVVRPGHDGAVRIGTARYAQPDLRWHAEHDWVCLWMMSSRPAISVLSSVKPGTRCA
jgi:hypothetical protein